jgi:hypothetical protein
LATGFLSKALKELPSEASPEQRVSLQEIIAPAVPQGSELSPRQLWRLADLCKLLPAAAAQAKLFDQKVDEAILKMHGGGQ